MSKTKKIDFWANIIAGTSIILLAALPMNMLLNFLQVFASILQNAIDEGMSQEFQLVFALAFIYLMIQVLKFLIDWSVTFFTKAEKIKKEGK